MTVPDMKLNVGVPPQSCPFHNHRLKILFLQKSAQMQFTVQPVSSFAWVKASPESASCPKQQSGMGPQIPEQLGSELELCF